MLVKEAGKGSGPGSFGREAAVRCCARCRRPQAVISACEEGQKDPAVQPWCVWVGSAMAAGASNARAFVVLAVMHLLLFCQCHFLRCIHHCLEKGHQWQQAFGVLAGMQQTAILHDVISYKAAISACVKGPMQSKLLEPQVFLYLRLLANIFFVGRAA